MNRNTVILIVILIALALGGYYVYRRHAAQAPTNTAPTYVGPTSDKPTDIDQDLNKIDTGSNLESNLDASTSQDIQAL